MIIQMIIIMDIVRNDNDNEEPLKAKPKHKPSSSPQKQALKQGSPSPQTQLMDSNGKIKNIKSGDFQPTYYLNKEQHKSVPTAEISGFLKILPPKQRKHFSGENKIKNPSSVE
eukprot:531412_1